LSFFFGTGIVAVDLASFSPWQKQVSQYSGAADYYYTRGLDRVGCRCKVGK